MIKQFQLECPKLKQLIYIDFDIISCHTQMDNTYLLSLISKCPIVKNICEDCPYQDLVGKEINI